MNDLYFTKCASLSKRDAHAVEHEQPQSNRMRTVVAICGI